jgi:hypothetical protein
MQAAPLSTLQAPTETARTWTNRSGKTMVATMLGVRNGKVRLRRGDKEFDYALNKLSDPDQEYARNHAALQVREDAEPAREEQPEVTAALRPLRDRIDKLREIIDTKSVAYLDRRKRALKPEISAADQQAIQRAKDYAAEVRNTASRLGKSGPGGGTTVGISVPLVGPTGKPTRVTMTLDNVRSVVARADFSVKATEARAKKSSQRRVTAQLNKESLKFRSLHSQLDDAETTLALAAIEIARFAGDPDELAREVRNAEQQLDEALKVIADKLAELVD